ncbi:hypothetical protein [Geobacter sp. DSM 9736]|uniref:hypothetical protein n=1 Tax=Geobacter sp. DSM 9736 TaxID=1277350 RepID=UPI000B61E6AE|nr:hypothetical protein [Geobacter sp. DSM 9736]SNB45813.1 hypothetical protein SAMN06269301_1242 [Geobacter sp. DSM 9736]
MFMNDDLGASVYKSWSNKQQRDEIKRLVEGYRNGLPVGVLCKMSEAIAGSRKRARRYIQQMLTPEERNEAVARETTEGMRMLLKEFML